MSTTQDIHTMRCMEVWGGNDAVDRGVAMPGLELWVRSEPLPGHTEGGDVHFVSSCGTGRISRMVVADVSGHGDGASSLAQGLRRLMRRFVNFVDQTRFVRALNDAIFSPTSGDFATSLTMTFFAPTRHLTLCNAGHPRPMFWSASTREWRVLAARQASARKPGTAPRNLPLGVLQPTEYEQFGLTLSENDLVLAYTDALVEARSPEGTPLGEAGVLKLLSMLDATRPDDLIPELMSALSKWCGGAPLEDDLTLLLLRQSGAAVSAGAVVRLKGVLKFLAIVLRNLLPIGNRPPIPWPEVSRSVLLGVSRRPEVEPAERTRPAP